MSVVIFFNEKEYSWHKQTYGESNQKNTGFAGRGRGFASPWCRNNAGIIGRKSLAQLVFFAFL